jgi:hypothetical protein
MPERSILCKVKEDERLRGGVVPEGHKQRYAAQGNEKSDAEIAQKCAFLFQFAAADMIQHRHPHRHAILDLLENVRLGAIHY